MNKLTKKQKIGMLIIAIVIVIGAVVALTVGFNFELKAQNTKKIELYIQQEPQIADIEKIAKDVIGKKAIAQKIEVYGDTVAIMAEDITEEQKQAIIEKVNEKYQLEIQADSTKIDTMPHLRLRDIVRPYIVPFIIATLIILVYMAIRYKSLGITKTVVKTAIITVLVQVILFSIIAITRIPVGRLTIPMVITAYLATMLLITNKLENNLAISKEEKK